MPAASTAPWPALPERPGPQQRLQRREAPAAAAARPAAAERARRRVVGLVFAIYLLAIFEGALRKWVAPQFSQYIFFIRDPLLIVAYFIAARHGLWPRRQAFFKFSLLMCGVGALLLLLQAATGGFSELRLVLGVYGWRAYFLYVPLAFLVGAVFQAPDLLRFTKLTLALSVPIALLVAAQFFSPQGAAINVGIAADEALQFRGLGLDGERTRPMGPFSSGAGQQQFVATACALLLACFLAPRRLPQPSWPWLWAAAAGVLTCVALSGSRGTVLQCGLSVLFAMAVGVLGRGAALKRRALAWPLLLVAAAIVLYPLLFPEGFAAFMARWQTAQAAESLNFETGVFGRALYGLVDFVRLIEQVPALGYGLGYGGNASITLRATVDGVMPGYLAETDFARHMVDLGPLFGMGYIVFRLLLAAWLVALVLRATRLAADPMPMLLLSYVAYVVLLGQITGQGAINVYGWLFAGLLMAACRASTHVSRTTAPTRPFLRPRTIR